MRFAIFSDIHANLQAWEAVLADIRSQAVDTLVCLGDVVGYGPMPGPVLESVYQHTDNFVLGNHDAVVGGRIDAGTFNQHARYVIQWTADQLGDEGAAFFAQVPLTLRGEKMLFTHGDAARPGHFDYVVKAEDSRPSFQACKDEVIFFGHTHDPCVFACANNRGIIDKLPGEDLVLSKGRRYMVNPGSVGDPRSANDLRGSYCIYDDTTRRLTFRKVEFDAEAYRADLKASGLEMLPYFLRVIDAGSRRPEEEDELAVVADHREAVEVDETMTAQPRALVTVGSPMANRAKLHFGYAPQRPQPYQAAEQYRQAMPHTRQLHQAPMPPKKRNGTAVLIVGMLLGVIALIWAMGYSSEPSKEDLGDLGGHVKKKQSPMLSKEDGWEEAAP
ncbi:MAG: putative phosphodiesterase, partial [Verrucomicrobiales bacterium]